MALLQSMLPYFYRIGIEKSPLQNNKFLISVIPNNLSIEKCKAVVGSTETDTNIVIQYSSKVDPFCKSL